MKTRVLVISDVRILRDCLASNVAALADCSVAGVAPNRAEGVALAERLRPTAVILDRTMPESLIVAREILAVSPSTRILALGVQETEPAVAACAEAGIAGYLPRDASSEGLANALRRLVRGDLVCSTRVAELLAQSSVRSHRPCFGTTPLTSRETQIAHLLELGLSNKEVATRLGIEVATVKNHVHKLLRKVDARCRSQVAGRWRRYAPNGGAAWSTRTSG